DEVSDAGLLGPAVGFVGFDFEFGYGFDGITRRTQFDFLGVEFVSSIHGAGESAIALVIEARADGFESVGQQRVAVGIENGETGRNRGWWREHGVSSVWL